LHEGRLHYDGTDAGAALPRAIGSP
ncbi:MAG: hypothetical protein RLZ32_339, partial [Gemmatimonadota bacterium]